MGGPTTVTTSGADPLTSATYDVAGRVTALTFGSGDTANFGFSTNSGRMTSYKETINGSVVSGTLTWSANGELQQNVIVDPFNTANAQTCTYDYDDLARIKATNCGTPWTQTFTYDVFGNLTKSGSLNWQPGYSAYTNRYTLGGISYDANGNLLNDMFHTYTWDAQGKAHTIDTTTIIYDAFGNQVDKQSGGVNTEFVLGFAVMNGQTQLKAFVLLPGGAKARYVAGTISGYTVPDWVGSMRIGSKATQAYDFSLAFAPFGERYAVSGGSPYEFGGNQNNTVADEYDADNRKIHTSQGRWISPDPAGFGAASLASPQTWNRYAYVANNPLTNIDPSGLLLSDCVSCNFFNDALSAVNQTIDWSIEAQTKAFFGDKYNDLPGHNNQMATGQFSYLQDVYGGQNVTAGPNGFVITFAVSFWGPYKGGCLAGVFCIGHLTYNLFQFLDPAETKNFSFDTSFQNTVAAFKKAGFVEHWQDYLDRFHPRQLDLRDRSTFCSAHADVDKSSGQQAGQATTGQVHLDTINPWEPWFFQMPIEHYVISKVESKPCS